MAIHSVEPITTFQRPDLAPYDTMRLQAEHRRQRIFVAEGEKVVRRLLESDLQVLSVLLPEKWFRQLTPELERRSETIRVYTAEKKLLEQLTGYSMYQGLLAIARVPLMPTLDELLVVSPRPRLYVATDGLANAENIGALVRNCAAFNTHGLLVGETSSSPYIRRAVRASMGTVFRLPVFESADLVQTLSYLRQHSIRCIAAHPHATGRSLPETDLACDCCIVLGSEGHGLSPAVLEACDEAVAVPMSPHVDSLNVGSAAAVFLYEACRQRGMV